MHRQDFCESCDQKHDCREVYRQLGKAEGRSVVFKVVIAFLLPIMVFVAALAAFEAILSRITDIKEWRIVLSFLPALSVTFAVVLIIKMIGKQLRKDR